MHSPQAWQYALARSSSSQHGMRRQPTGDRAEAEEDQMNDYEYYEQLSKAALEAIPEARRSMV